MIWYQPARANTTDMQRRSLHLARPVLLMIALAAVLLACTGRGGGYLAPDGVAFTGKGVFGFTFSCERSSNSTNTNPQPGRLRLEVSYSDLGRSMIGSSFAIHGVADEIDPIDESQICVGQEPPPGGNELVILGRYRPVNGAPAAFPASCRTQKPACRFEVIVRDNDGDRAPSRGDFFSIRLSTVTDLLVSEFPDATVFYARGGLLAGGNLTVD